MNERINNFRHTILESDAYLQVTYENKQYKYYLTFSRFTNDPILRMIYSPPKIRG